MDLAHLRAVERPRFERDCSSEGPLPDWGESRTDHEVC